MSHLTTGMQLLFWTARFHRNFWKTVKNNDWFPLWLGQTRTGSRQKAATGSPPLCVNTKSIHQLLNNPKKYPILLPPFILIITRKFILHKHKRARHRLAAKEKSDKATGCWITAPPKTESSMNMRVFDAHMCLSYNSMSVCTYSPVYVSALISGRVVIRQCPCFCQNSNEHDIIST